MGFIFSNVLYVPVLKMQIMRFLGQVFEHGLVRDLLQTVLSAAPYIKPGYSDSILIKEYSASVSVSQSC